MLKKHVFWCYRRLKGQWNRTGRLEPLVIAASVSRAPVAIGIPCSSRPRAGRRPRQDLRHAGAWECESAVEAAEYPSSSRRGGGGRRQHGNGLGKQHTRESNLQWARVRAEKWSGRARSVLQREAKNRTATATPHLRIQTGQEQSLSVFAAVTFFQKKRKKKKRK